MNRLSEYTGEDSQRVVNTRSDNTILRLSRYCVLSEGDNEQGRDSFDYWSVFMNFWLGRRKCKFEEARQVKEKKARGFLRDGGWIMGLQEWLPIPNTLITELHRYIQTIVVLSEISLLFVPFSFFRVSPTERNFSGGGGEAKARAGRVRGIPVHSRLRHQRTRPRLQLLQV